MKKTLIALAVLAAAGAASAQSSVTIFGVVDATIQRIDNGAGGSVTRLHNSGESSSRLGFRGVEDLGGGMSAQFWLEAGVNNDDGTGQASNANNQFLAPVALDPTATTARTVAASGVRPGQQGLMFNRRSTVSLAGGFGEIRLGRDYTPQFYNLNVFDPYGTVGVGAQLLLSSVGANPTSVRASNSIGYLLPSNLGGIYGQAQYYRGENVSTTANTSDGNGWGLRLGYAAGPLNVAAATSRTTYRTVPVAAATATALATPATGQVLGNIRQTNVGASFDFGVAKLMGVVSRDTMASVAGSIDGRGWMLGATMPVGAGLIKASWAQYTTDLPGTGTDPRARKYALGYVHNLSKRTAIYTTYARVNNTNGVAGFASQAVTAGAGAPVLNGSSTGYDLGIRHSF